ncbi:hypothetical protein Q6331_27355, partial [Klebsiella pneumoniae]|nr:hypothetical protein [Klebsiella pneumoniae]
AGAEPIQPQDIADTIFWVMNTPAHVNINRLELMPVSQTWAGFAIERGGKYGFKPRRLIREQARSHIWFSVYPRLQMKPAPTLPQRSGQCIKPRQQQLIISRRIADARPNKLRHRRLPHSK